MSGQITTQQAAEELGVTRSRVIALVRNGRLPAQKFGSAWMIDPGDLDKVRERPTGRPPKVRVEAPTKKARGKGK